MDEVPRNFPFWKAEWDDSRDIIGGRILAALEGRPWLGAADLVSHKQQQFEACGGFRP